jgi:hypothetical protein
MRTSLTGAARADKEQGDRLSVDSRCFCVYPRRVIFAVWLVIGSVFGLICGLLAVGRNRSATGWFLMGLLFGPFAVAALFLKQRRQEPSFL